MTRREDLKKKGKSKRDHCSSTSHSAWTLLNKIGTALRKHDLCLIREIKRQKLNKFTKKQFELEMKGFLSSLQKILKGG